MSPEEAQKYIDAIGDVAAISGGGQNRWIRTTNKVTDLVPDRVMCQKGVYHLNRYWIGDVPSVCNLNPDRAITDEFIDGRTIYGQWAIMHPETHANVGCGLGEGRGQMYRKVLDRWFKVTAT